MDVLSKEQRHKNMSNTRCRDTRIEIILRKALWQRKIRYRVNYKNLPGKPDIVLTKYKIAIFCDGEFYHGYNWEERREKIDTNRDFWVNKIENNMLRDKEINIRLKEMDWKVIRFWGEEIKKDINKCLNIIEKAIC